MTENTKTDELRYKIKHQISKHTGTGNALNSYATLKEINNLGDEIMELVTQYGIQERIDELKNLPVNWESCYDNTLRKHYSKVYDDVYNQRLKELEDQLTTNHKGDQ